MSGEYVATDTDTDRLVTVAGYVRTHIDKVREIRNTVLSVNTSVAHCLDMSGAYLLCDEFVDESQLVADAMQATKDYLDVADQYGPASANKAALDALLARLGLGLGDGHGSSGSADDVAHGLEVRAFGDSDVPKDVEAYTLGLLAVARSDQEIRAIWKSLTDAQRLELISRRPDIIGFSILAAGTELTEYELRKLDFASSYVTSEQSLELDVDASIQLRVFTIELGGSASVTVQQFSDGTVKMIISTEVYGGAGIAGKYRGSGVSAELVATLGHGSVLQFANAQEAHDAITDLKAAVEDDLTTNWARTGRYGLGWGVDAALTPALFLRVGGGWLGLDVPTPGKWLDGDQRPDSLQEIDRLIDEHGVETTRSVGARLSGNADLDLIDLAGLEGNASFTQSAYYTEAAAGSGEADRWGVVMTGSASGSGDIDQSPLLPDDGRLNITGSAEVGYAQDFSVDSNGNATSVTTLFVETRVGTVGEIGLGNVVVDADNSPVGSQFELSRTDEVSTRHTVVIQVPVNAETRDLLGNAASGLASGNLDQLGDLADHADITITQQDGVHVTHRVEVDNEVVDVSVSLSQSNNVTISNTHKPPGGDFYDRAELDGVIDRAIENRGS